MRPVLAHQSDVTKRVERTKHDQPAPWPAICAGPWRIAARLAAHVYLFRCENCSDERMMFVPTETTSSHAH